ncbi:unnamed protein product [Nippostrongylus brasiliensis]|uniref:Uracil-DNA glycosylase n=1 Tax=Nippostrongylus brasiliensis TaxID=27835 RepID=A0A0N4Y778_NIPBR|nr:unnamed protein product [Nippostrongylus brasiliensis]
MSAPTTKIPEMFLRAMKRKAEVVTFTAGDEDELKKKRLDLQNSNVSEASKENSCSVGVFSLYSLLRDSKWRSALKEEFHKKYMDNIESFLRSQYAKNVPIFPPRNEIFSAFNLTPIDKIRVVIIGQDPYHGIGQAHGLCFSVKKGVPPPPSLKNIYKELYTDIPGFVIPNHGFLEKWALQGVFMLNATLTVESGKANSHEKIGWQTFTDKVISIISSRCTGVVFLLWGGFAQKKECLVDKRKHAVIKTAHPSPLSARKWFGCKCFSRTNDELGELYIHAEACITEAFESEVITAYSEVPELRRNLVCNTERRRDDDNEVHNQSSVGSGITIKKSNGTAREEFVTLKVGDEVSDGITNVGDNNRFACSKDDLYHPRLITYTQTLEGPHGLRLVVSVEKPESLELPPSLTVEETAKSQSAFRDVGTACIDELWEDDDMRLNSGEPSGA